MTVPGYTPSQFQAVEALLMLSSQLNGFVGKDLSADLSSIYIRSVPPGQSSTSNDNPFASLKIEKAGGLKQFFSRIFKSNTYSIAKVDQSTGQVNEGSVGQALHKLHDELKGMTPDVILSILKAKELDKSTLSEMHNCIIRLNAIVDRAEVHNEKKVQKSVEFRQAIGNAFDNLKLHIGGAGLVDKRTDSFKKSVELIRAARAQMNIFEKTATSLAIKAAHCSDKNGLLKIKTELENIEKQAMSAYETLLVLPDQPLLSTTLVPVKEGASAISEHLANVRVLSDNKNPLGRVIIKYYESAKIKYEVLELTDRVAKLVQEARVEKNLTKLKKAMDVIQEARAKQIEQRNVPKSASGMVYKLRDSENASKADNFFEDIQDMQLPIGTAINEAERLVADLEKELSALPRTSKIADMPKATNPKPPELPVRLKGPSKALPSKKPPNK